MVSLLQQLHLFATRFALFAGAHHVHPLAQPQGAVDAFVALRAAELHSPQLHQLCHARTHREDVAGQAVNDCVWRSPLSLNRRVVVQGDKVYAALNYRQGPLSVLDAGTGKTIHAVDVGGIVDEIIADGDLVICRVRQEIAMPSERLKNANGTKTQKELKDQGIKDPTTEFRTGMVYDSLTKNENETLVAIDAGRGKILWRREGPLVGTDSFVMAEGEVTNSKHYLTTETPSGITVRAFGEKRYIEIEAPAKASHTHDHATIDIDEGVYIQIPERELDNWSLLVRNVKD
jgi:hypothetical protein